MTTPASTSPLLLKAPAGGGGYAIERSLRFNSADSAYLSRTPASGNRKTFTFATWVRLCNTNNTQNLLNAGNNTTTGRSIFRYSSQKFALLASAVGGTTAADVSTDAIFRDFSAWYHVVWAIDTTEATGSDRVKCWVNGVSQQLTFTTTPGLDGIFSINNNSLHQIGGAVYTAGQYPDFYLADCFLIDGQALDPTSFGEFDDNGIWQPIAYSGSYGTNGFHLDFSDNSTAAALGTDTSGNGNTWTVNNISVAAGAGNDSLVDVPTNGTEEDTGVGGEVRGNYCTWNPLANAAAQLTYSNGNLDLAVTNVASYAIAVGSIGLSSGKWYFEVGITSSGLCRTGIARSDSGLLTFLGGSATTYAYASDGYKANNNSNSATGYSTYTNGDLVSVALDLDNGKVFFAKNGTWQESGDPAAGTNAAYTGLTGTFFPAWSKGDYAATSCILNAGQRPFAYTAPSGFKALCTTNLPAPTIEDPSTVMDVALYTGNGTTQTITGLNMSPDLVWIKDRSAAGPHHLYDTVRGVEKILTSSYIGPENWAGGGTAPGDLTAFSNDGFTIRESGGYAGNTNGSTYVAWCWNAGDSTVTNNDGSIASQVRAGNGFSVVTYTGNGTNSATVGHGLNIAPSMIIIKDRSAANHWAVVHTSCSITGTTTIVDPEYKMLRLDYNDAEYDYANLVISPGQSSTTFTLGDQNNVNALDNTYVAYCFAPVAGYSAFGSWTNNNSTDGVFVYTGMRPRFILLKNTDNVEQWFIFDSARRTYNVTYPDPTELRPNSSAEEGSYNNLATVDFLSNGFKIRGNTQSEISFGTRSYIYAAFAENPFALNARAR